MKDSNVILVTGGCGYLGSQLIRDIAEDPELSHHTIRILDNMQSNGYQALSHLPNQTRYEFVEADILNPVSVKRALQNVHTVVHLAAVVRTPLSFDHPRWTEQVNHWGTAQLLEACIESQVQRFVFVSSASVYGPGEAFTEEDTCKPVGPYAQSKWHAENAVRTAAERGLNTVVLRMATFMGHAPAARYYSVPNRFAYLAGIGRSLTVFGDGQQHRPVVHVKDACTAIRFSLLNFSKLANGTFNVVGQVVSIMDMIEAVLANDVKTKVHFTEQHVLTHFNFSADSSRIRGLGWTPHYRIEDAMTEMLELYSSVQSIRI